MSVTEHPAEPMHDASTHTPLDPQAALELAHELVLVTRATFAQLLPETAERAVSGVPGLGADIPEVPQQAATSQAAPTVSVAIPTGTTQQPAPVTASPAVVPDVPPTVTVPPVVVRSSAVRAVVPAADEPHEAPAPAASMSVPVAVALVAPAVEPMSSESTPHEVAPPAAAPAIAGTASGVPVAVEAPLDYVPVPVGTPDVAILPSIPAVQTEVEVPAVAETPTAPHRPLHPSLAMLEEIGFLDE